MAKIKVRFLFSLFLCLVVHFKESRAEDGLDHYHQGNTASNLSYNNRLNIKKEIAYYVSQVLFESLVSKNIDLTSVVDFSRDHMEGCDFFNINQAKIYGSAVFDISFGRFDVINGADYSLSKMKEKESWQYEYVSSRPLLCSGLEGNYSRPENSRSLSVNNADINVGESDCQRRVCVRPIFHYRYNKSHFVWCENTSTMRFGAVLDHVKYGGLAGMLNVIKNGYVDYKESVVPMIALDQESKKLVRLLKVKNGIVFLAFSRNEHIGLDEIVIKFFGEPATDGCMLMANVYSKERNK